MTTIIVKNGFISHTISQVAGGAPAMACLSILLVAAYLQTPALHADKAHGKGAHCLPLTDLPGILDSCITHHTYL